MIPQYLGLRISTKNKMFKGRYAFNKYGYCRMTFTTTVSLVGLKTPSYKRNAATDKQQQIITDDRSKMACIIVSEAPHENA